MGVDINVEVEMDIEVELNVEVYGDVGLRLSEM